MGVTYRATDTLLQCKVALKLIKTDIAERSADARERFVREARAAAALRHENIAVIHQFGMRLETGQYFYAMELIEGETLDERVHRAGPIDARITIGIAEQVTSALAAAEKHGLVHRDLKPANLMLVNPDDAAVMESDQARFKRSKIRALRKSGIPVVKIIDFGLAKALGTAMDPKSLTHDRFVGTPAFASPEQFEHSALDVRSDIYSLGETLWFALTGKTPFAGRTLSEIHDAQKSNALPTEQLKAAHVPHRLRSLLESMLAFEPASRPGTVELAARLRRCAPETRSMQRTRAALVLAAVVVCGLSIPPVIHQCQVEPPAPEKSIAVLPFENLSKDEENAFFAAGVQDEVLSYLARIADLKVISRTSVMQYKSGIERNVRKIGQQLGVANVVEGSVQRSGNRVRVNAQLVDTRTDRHLWAQTYDRDLADVFAIQSEIAKTIADQLQAKLSPAEKSAIERVPTSDVIAFALYTRANNLLLTAVYSGTTADLLDAASLLNQAVARDPSFLHAYCKLAYVHDALYFLGYDHTTTRLELADMAVQAASHLNPDAGETHLAQAWNFYWGYLAYDDALAELEAAHRTLPNDSRIFQLMALIQRRKGRAQESIRNFERSIRLDPLNVYTLQQAALSYGMLRQYAEEKLLFRRVLAIQPNDPVMKAEHAFVELDWKADSQPLHQVIDLIRSSNRDALPKIASYWLICALAERDPDSAKNALIASGEDSIWLGLTDNVPFNHPFIEGLIARMTKDDGKARSAFADARAEQQKIAQAQPNYGPVWCVLGLIDAGLGRKDEALREGRRAVELLPVEKDEFGGITMVKYLAMIAAWVDDKDLACQQLAIAIRHPNRLGYGQLKLLPFWDSLRGDPRFEKLLEEVKQPLAPE
jgi:serine/threonine-protein kinase